MWILTLFIEYHTKKRNTGLKETNIYLKSSSKKEHMIRTLMQNNPLM